MSQEAAAKAESVQKTIALYLSQRVPEFRRLSELRQKGWNNVQGDAFFQRQRQSADCADEQTAAYFYKLMQTIGTELQTATRAFTIHDDFLSRPPQRSASHHHHNGQGQAARSIISLSPQQVCLIRTGHSPARPGQTMSSVQASQGQTSSSPSPPPLPQPQDASILDLCMAPGGFLATALAHNPQARALAFSLPPQMGGHKIRLPPSLLLPPNPIVQHRLVDITLLAQDLDYSLPIPDSHPDTFLPLQLDRQRLFSLVLCDGQVLRTHARAPYRLVREPRRLSCAQLALALAHTRPGGSILCLLHKPESWSNMLLLRSFSRFATLRLYKPRAGHAKRSSFYMLASNVQSNHPEAKAAVLAWKNTWAVATFGSEDEYWQHVNSVQDDVEAVLQDFGPQFISLASSVWKVQADALEKAPFIRDAKGPSLAAAGWTRWS
ncbi:hypothetical protein CDD81_578 [Ophiocordyceps australis]|uniref:Ribosomal RNA methyltransferase FtsJ domain-containing protein n=1 Tax=Ophiocordyceps australis TaxID=1399860 RepID=A0A2C5YEL5_9HYPO|nr:hypothetical protein CDD81_578 [Ophiocordyceps australis]